MTGFIETPRLRIRDVTLDDLDVIRGNFNDIDVIRYLMIWFETDQELEGFIKDTISQSGLSEKKEYFLSIDTLDPVRFVGNAILVLDHDSNSTAEIGYLLSKSEWGKGYATETARALVKFCFETLKMHRVYGKCDERNPSSAHVLQKCGMTYEGTLREHVWLRDHWRSSQVYGIIDREFRGQ